MALNDYSIRFAAKLFNKFPALRSRMAERPEDDGCFSVETKSPTGLPLWIRTEVNPMLTVGFGPYHSHFGGFSESVDDEAFDQAIAYIQGILSGEYILLVRTWEDGGSRTDIVHKDAMPGPELGCQFKVKAWTDSGPRNWAEPWQS